MTVGTDALKKYCLKAIKERLETRKIEQKGAINIEFVKDQSVLIKTMLAIANSPPDPTLPYGLIIVGVKNGKILNNVHYWAKDDNEYQNLIRKYCAPMIPFSFHVIEHEGKKFGVFVIENTPGQLYFVKEDLVEGGKVLLAKGQLYYRRGSETRLLLTNEELDEIFISSSFRKRFLLKLTETVNAIKNGGYADHKIDDLIGLCKEVIERWDASSLIYVTEELFRAFYSFSDWFVDKTLYPIYRDLFKLAYKERKQLLGRMLQTLEFILLRSWIEYDIEKAEKCSDIVLRLGIDFIEEDIDVSKDCLIVLTNIAGDMSEKEVLSKIILFGAYVYNKYGASHPFVNEVLDSICTCADYALDDLYYGYLIDSLEYAKQTSKLYNIYVEPFENDMLLPIIIEMGKNAINEFIDYLVEPEEESGDIDFEIKFYEEEIDAIVRPYKKVMPNIMDEMIKKLNEKLLKVGNKHIFNRLRKISKSKNPFLKKLLTNVDLDEN